MEMHDLQMKMAPEIRERIEALRDQLFNIIIYRGARTEASAGTTTYQVNS